MFEQLDFASFHSSDPAERDEFCRKLVSSLQEYGFVRLRNHGVAPAAIDKAFKTSRRFFHLPYEQKMKSPHPPNTKLHRGFSSYGMEQVSAISSYGRKDGSPRVPLVKDMKESYDIGSDLDPDYDNVWPPTGICDTFQPTFVDFFEECYRAQFLILDAISVGLGLPTQALRQLHAAQCNEMRLAHYPAVPRDSFSHSTRIATHSDFGSITLLFQDKHDGLQVELPPDSGEFVDIASGGPYECVLNSGDCLQKLTGLPSARHRVHLPNCSADSMLDERFSIAYFGKPDRTASLCPLLDYPGVRNDAASKLMTAGEFQQLRIQGTYA